MVAWLMSASSMKHVQAELAWRELGLKELGSDPQLCRVGKK